SLPFGTMFVAPAMPDFLRQYPNLAVDLSFTDDVVNLLEEKADVAIRMGNLPDSTLKARKLAQSRRVVCAAPSYLKRRGTPQVPGDLQNHNCLTLNFKPSRVGWPVPPKRRDIYQPVSRQLSGHNSRDH